ncbi:FecR family protein [Pedobacter agri]|uniref:FecR family protein n=1 Tax=Pedobacter agri TaxID=454586 RepID=UPI00292F9845|nr:FecR domain-containing protein [Pedobacter agri]
MDKQRISYIVSCYLKQTATLSELNELKVILADKRNEHLLKDLLEEEYYLLKKDSVLPHINQTAKDNGLKIITSFPQKKSEFKILPIFYSAAAAAILVILSVLIYNTQSKKENLTKVKSVITPGKFGAILTLSNGKKIALADVKNGQFASEDGVKISKTAQGKIQYSGAASKENLTNSVSTANGQTYQVVLPDGSRIWLNSASKISYKASLVENGLRKVQLSGEAYFEIAQDKTKPFIVVSENQEVKVLGTHFNISSYPNDDVHSTTLLEGQVTINGTKLNPGYQALLKNGNVVVNKTDVRMAIDWKNGEFICVNTPLSTLMNKISRWYDVEIVYLNNSSKSKTFSGSLSRYDDLEQLLKVLDFANIKSKTENRKIYITN